MTGHRSENEDVSEATMPLTEGCPRIENGLVAVTLTNGSVVRFDRLALVEMLRLLDESGRSDS